jgi:hypothetical protein
MAGKMSAYDPKWTLLKYLTYYGVGHTIHMEAPCIVIKAILKMIKD